MRFVNCNSLLNPRIACLLLAAKISHLLLLGCFYCSSDFDTVCLIFSSSCRFLTSILIVLRKFQKKYLPRVLVEAPQLASENFILLIAFFCSAVDTCFRESCQSESDFWWKSSSFLKTWWLRPHLSAQSSCFILKKTSSSSKSLSSSSLCTSLAFENTSFINFFHQCILYCSFV